MTTVRKALAVCLAVVSMSAVSVAGERKAGKAGTKSTETSRSVTAQSPGERAAVPARKVDPSTSRSPALAPEQAKKNYSLVGRTRDGKEVRKEPSEDVIRAITGVMKRGAAETTSREASRAVIGKDNRKLVRDTTEYPNSAIGNLWYSKPNEKKAWSACTAAMIGPRTLLVAANCLYWHGFDSAEEEGWLDNFEFYPAVEDNTAVLGSFRYDTAYVFSGFIDEYDGTWDSVWTYNVGLVTFSENIADYTGYLGIWDFGTDMEDFQATLREIPGDKRPPNSMWRSVCVVSAERIHELYFLHTCDADEFSAPITVTDEEGDFVVGIDQGIVYEGGSNWALRLQGPVYQWVSEMSEAE